MVRAWLAFCKGVWLFSGWSASFVVGLWNDSVDRNYDYEMC